MAGHHHKAPRLEVVRTEDVPIKEVSGVCLQARCPRRVMSTRGDR